MTGGVFGPGGLGPGSFDEFLARFFGGGPEQRRPMQRVDIGRLLTERARELVTAAAQHAANAAAPTSTPSTCCGEPPGPSRPGRYCRKPAPTRTRSAARSTPCPSPASRDSNHPR